MREKESANPEFKSGDMVVIKTNKKVVYTLLYIIGSYAKCRSYSGAERHVRLSALEKYNPDMTMSRM
jgi:hypothetical protein